MALFMLDTEGVMESSGIFKDLATNVSSVGDAVGSLNVDNKDGFNFAAARTSIVNNINACAIKLSNSSTFLSQVVESHTKLQEMKFIDPMEKAKIEAEQKAQEEKKKKEEQKKKEGKDFSPSRRGNPSNPTRGDSEKRKGNDGKTQVVVAGVTGIASDKAVNVEKTANSEEKVIDNSKSDVVEKDIDKSIIKDVGYAYIDLTVVPEATATLFNDKDFNSQESGYAMIGSRYVIACNSEIGNVGDVVVFTKNDDSTVECVVGYNTVSDKYKDSISFIVDSEKKTVIESEDTKLLLTDLKSIKNRGPLSELNKNENSGIDVNDALPSDNNSTSENTLLASSDNKESTEKGVEV